MVQTIEYFAGLSAVLSTEEFLSNVPGPGVLIRLDERGGKDEPSPWAFKNITKTIPRPFAKPNDPNAEEIRSVLEEVTSVSKVEPSNVFTNAPADEITNTLALPPQALPVPGARGAAKVFVIPKSDHSVTIGRHPDTSDLAITEMSISKKHARLSWKAGGHLTITDLGSSNGTQVNNKVLRKEQTHKVVSGDQILLGDLEFLYLNAAMFRIHVQDFMD